jgi:uncharacterized membrane protein YfcA
MRRLWLMQAGIFAGVALAWLLFSSREEAFGKSLLGGCLMVYGALGLAGWRMKQPRAGWERRMGLVVGGLTGIVTGLTGVFVLPAVPYLQSLGLGRETLAQALGLSFTTSTVALALMLAMDGHLNLGTSMASALVMVPALLGMVLGQVIRKEMSETLFRRCFFVGLALLGGWLLVR